ncbi:MAG: fasciclin domain-containing protein [Phycisphaeraceae bacterium]|nr:fasciclin domain-containing protein [Phycisphaeraceae bacterium]MCW5763579.1 fasciclin domain-containing protein [Phycisphaeraceae bacterium]
MTVSQRLTAVLALSIGAGLASAGPDKTCAPTCASAVTAASAQIADIAHQAPDIIDTALAAGNFKTLAAALTAADLVGALKGQGPFTVFAPTDEAFAKLPKGTIETLLKPENKKMLQAVLLYHVVPGVVPASQVVKTTGATTLGGQRIEINASSKGVMIDGAKVTATDIKASNGIIHVIDSVILPESKNIVEVAAASGSFSTLLAAAKAAGLADLLGSEGPFTILAPTDEAFEKLGAATISNLLKPENREKLAAVLKFHVVPGRIFARDALVAGAANSAQGGSLVFSVREGRLVVNGISILATDIDASNGVIHVIDSVLLPE